MHSNTFSTALVFLHTLLISVALPTAKNEEGVLQGRQRFLDIYRVMETPYETAGAKKFPQFPLTTWKKLERALLKHLAEMNAHAVPEFRAADRGTFTHVVEGLLANIDQDVTEFSALNREDLAVSKLILRSLALYHDLGKMSAARASSNPLTQFFSSLAAENKMGTDRVFTTIVGPHEFHSADELWSHRAAFGLNDSQANDLIRMGAFHNFLGFKIDGKDPRLAEGAWPSFIWPVFIKNLETNGKLPPEILEKIKNYGKSSNLDDPYAQYLIDRDRSDSVYKGPRKIFNEQGGEVTLAKIESILAVNGASVPLQLAALPPMGGKIPSWRAATIERCQQLGALANLIKNAQAGSKASALLKIPGPRRPSVLFNGTKKPKNQYTTPADAFLDLLNRVWKGHPIPNAPGKFSGGL